MHNVELSGIHILQIADVFNAGCNYEHRASNPDKSGRLLKLFLTDGKKKVSFLH